MKRECEMCKAPLTGQSSQRFCGHRCKMRAWRRFGGNVPVVPDEAVLRFIEQTRFWRKVQKSGGCWDWKASKNGYGYGQFMPTGSRKPRSAHILAYEWLVGLVPQGHELHHTCENHGCVNPAHLEPLTRREHLARHPRAPKPERFCVQCGEGPYYAKGKCRRCYYKRREP